MKILRLEAANVKRLRAVEIRFDPNKALVPIRGDNANGKSSVLDAIAYALAGKESHPPRVIRDGEETAHVVVEFEDLIIKRKWTKAGATYLEAENREGAKYGSPQAKLDKLFGQLSFDPLAFTRQAPGEQLDTLRRLVGLDFSALDRERKTLYDERTVVNREVNSLEARVKSLPEAPATPAENIEDLLAEQEMLTQSQRDNDAARRAANLAAAELDAANNDVQHLKTTIEDLERKLEQLRAKLADEKVRAQAKLEAFGTLSKRAEGLVDPNLDDINARIRAAYANTAAAARAQQRAALAAELDARRAASQKMTARLDEIDAAKAKALAEAKFPIAGLSCPDTGVTFNGVPLVQASSAEKLRVGMAIGLALNPDARILLVRDGSLLDEKSLAMVAEMTAAADGQVLIEMVPKDGEGVVIEDGSVVSVNGVPPGQQTLLEPTEKPKKARATT